jgi:alcohol-forming fatty acyl-CoA reductase
VDKAVEVIGFFTNHQWEFANENVLMLMNKLNTEDLKTFNFNVKKINWSLFIEKYCIGAKRFILKEDLEKINKQKKSLKRRDRIVFMTKLMLAMSFIRFCLLRRYTLKQMFMFIFKLALNLRYFFRI